MNLPPFKLERFLAQYEFQVAHPLCCSDCESFSVQELLAFEPDADARLRQLWLGYTDTRGQLGLRQEIAQIYQQITPEQVLVHSGAAEPIFIFMHALLERGDHVIVPDPCYQALRDIAAARGCHITKWTAQEDRDWDFDVDFLRRHLRKTTKALILNTPHNPTGNLMRLETYQQVIEIARERKLYVFADEVYRGLEYNTDDRLPAACDLYERAVSLGVMSKTYGLPGLRIGWIATRDAEIYARMAAFKDFTTICNSAPSEFLAALALRHQEQIIQRNREIIFHNLHLLHQFFNRFSHLFQWVAPQAGPIAFPRLSLDRDIHAICVDLAERHGVLLLPSDCWDFGAKHFRIGFGRKHLEPGLAKFAEYLLERNFA